MLDGSIEAAVTHDDLDRFALNGFSNRRLHSLPHTSIVSRFEGRVHYTRSERAQAPVAKHFSLVTPRVGCWWCRHFLTLPCVRAAQCRPCQGARPPCRPTGSGPRGSPLRA